ncbi:MAG: type II toxin-antitoxin system RelE/ParE family toxin [Bacteroidales bacterium]|nr:type II toxin-antitoxin system RelE/ParE family toxin [Bacteroidales bacterium]
MEVLFKDAGFEKLFLEVGGLERVYGPIRAKLIRTRIKILKSVDGLEKLWRYPGHFHSLKGDRAGEWACSLDQPYRLIFKYEPESKVVIIEIVNYHGK